MSSGQTDAMSQPPSTFRTKQKPERLPITVEKPTPYTFDLGRLMALDPNPLNLPSNSLSNPPVLNSTLKSTARDGAQCLLNQLLTACPITSSATDGVLLTLPTPVTPLPRFKPLPTPKPPTKWELFARKKGIGKYNNKLGANEAERQKKLVYDEEKGEWVPRWGYKGKNKAEDDQWLVEVDDKKWKKEEDMNIRGESIRNEGRKERMERIRRNERKMRANMRRTGNAKSKA
ncbi:Rhodanese- sulfurtransferase [Coccidioides posadasii str. Silveira]|uniref:Ribosome biogenesis regulatory protein n=1 Tax=Coccidioides posadasii (strain RMSCC 757 / Silveira) TaxID=443226 RepID=E9DGP9_COCPS|nr:ribosome biogenesis protein [Coccidioides posadasii str. Silveira]QVM13659.1 Rhodanese- sulfurtransferase [Coccidioides posadasii str. Silveira]